jgi:hypothetical protein
MLRNVSSAKKGTTNWLMLKKQEWAYALGLSKACKSSIVIYVSCTCAPAYMYIINKQ